MEGLSAGGRKPFGGQFAGETRSDPIPCSRLLEYPHVVLIAATTAELFRGTKAAPIGLQFITKGDCHLTVRTLDSPGGHQRVAVPTQAGDDPAPRSVAATSRPSVRELYFVSNGLSITMVI